MYGPNMAILLMYESHDMRHTGFRRLTVVNGTPGNWGVTGHLRGYIRDSPRPIEAAPVVERITTRLELPPEP